MIRIPKKFWGKWYARKGAKVLFAENDFEQALQKREKRKDKNDITLGYFPETGMFVGAGGRT